MSAEVGMAVSEILDRAAKRHITPPECYREYLWQAHGAGAVLHYDGSHAYWRRIQAVLDCFFTAEQRVVITRRLAREAELAGLPEWRGLRASALAEARLAGLVEALPRIGLERVWGTTGNGSL